MKTFNYKFHGDVEVILRDDNTLQEVTQVGTGFSLRTSGDSIVLTTSSGVKQYPNNLNGLYQAYLEIAAFQVEYQVLTHGERLVVTDGESTKEIFFENTHRLMSTILIKGSRVVSTSVGPNTWTCYGAIGQSCDSRNGTDFNLGDMPFTYASYLQRVFGTQMELTMH